MNKLLRFKRLSPLARNPVYATAGAAGFDLSAAIEEPLTIVAWREELIPTGLAFEVPDGFELQIRPRSGLSQRLLIKNSPGTVDSDYRGEVLVRVCVQLDWENPVVIQPGDRIAQAVLAPVVRATFVEVEELSRTARGDGGFGSTGMSGSEHRDQG